VVGREPTGSRIYCFDEIAAFGAFLSDIEAKGACRPGSGGILVGHRSQRCLPARLRPSRSRPGIPAIERQFQQARTIVEGSASVILAVERGPSRVERSSHRLAMSYKLLLLFALFLPLLLVAAGHWTHVVERSKS